MGDLVTLGGSPGGEQSVLPLEFSGVHLVEELASDSKDDNPTLTADLLLLCFTSTRLLGTGDVDVWCAERAAASAPFNAPFEASAVNTTGFESSAALSLDGLTLWIGSNRAGGAGGMDIWRAERAERSDPWSTPVLEDNLNSALDDIPRPPALGNTLMPMASRRTGNVYLTYFAERADESATFQTPVLIPELTPEQTSGINVVDAHLSEDGLLMLFAMVPGEGVPSDLYAVERTSLDEPFSSPVALVGVNSEFNERDPWLSPDGQILYFSSDREGLEAIFQAERVRSSHN